MNLMQYGGINLSKSEWSSVLKGRRNGYETWGFQRKVGNCFTRTRIFFVCLQFWHPFVLVSVTYSKSHLIITVSVHLFVFPFKRKLHFSGCVKGDIFLAFN